MDAIIIDDEFLARQKILNLCKRSEDINVLEVCSNGTDAIDAININSPDLIFLDIHLKDIDGFEVLMGIETSKKPIIVFVTAYDEYAIKAFEFDVFDFLLKPFKEERFYKTIEKIRNLTKNEIQLSFENKINKLWELKNSNNISNKFPIKGKGKTKLINSQEINYICASGYYSEIFTERKKFVIRDSLTNIINQLDPQKFQRIHRSTIINIDFIDEILYSDFSELDLRMLDNNKFRVSKSQKKEFLKKLGI